MAASVLYGYSYLLLLWKGEQCNCIVPRQMITPKESMNLIFCAKKSDPNFSGVLLMNKAPSQWKNFFLKNKMFFEKQIFPGYLYR